MAITRSFAGVTIRKPGFWGVPLSDKQRAHNNIITLLIKLSVSNQDILFGSIHYQGKVEITNEK